jgi:hypothetical protein
VRCLVCELYASPSHTVLGCDIVPLLEPAPLLPDTPPLLDPALLLELLASILLKPEDPFWPGGLRASRSFTSRLLCFEERSPGAEGALSAAGPPMIVVVVVPRMGKGRDRGRKASSKLLVPRMGSGARSLSMGSVSADVTWRMVLVAPSTPSGEVVVPVLPCCCRGRLWRRLVSPATPEALFSARNHSAYSES